MNVLTQEPNMSNTALAPPPPLEKTASQWFLSCASLDEDDDDIVCSGAQPAKKEVDDDCASSVSTPSTFASEASWPLSSSSSPTTNKGRDIPPPSSLSGSLHYVRTLYVFNSSITTNAEMKEKETAATPMPEQIHLLGGLQDLLLEE